MGKKKILAADDSKTIRKAIEITFAKTDYLLDFAESGQVVLEKLESFQPDIVILDHKMPSPDGYELCKRIKDNSSTQNIQTVLLFSSKHPLDEGRAAVADARLAKPFDTQALLDLAEKLAEAPSAAAAEVKPAPAAAESADDIPVGVTLDDEDEFDEIEIEIDEPEIELEPEPIPKEEVTAAPPSTPQAKPAAPPSTPQAKPAAPPSALRASKDSHPPMAPKAPEAPSWGMSGVSAAEKVDSKGVGKPEVAETAEEGADKKRVSSAPLGAKGIGKPSLSPLASKLSLKPTSSLAARLARDKKAVPQSPKPASEQATPSPKREGDVQDSSIVGKTEVEENLQEEKRVQAPMERAVVSPPSVEEATSQVTRRAVDATLEGIKKKGPEYEAIAKLSLEMIERIVWEVVPELAEVIIKENIEKIARSKKS